MEKCFSRSIEIGLYDVIWGRAWLTTSSPIYYLDFKKVELAITVDGKRFDLKKFLDAATRAFF